MALTRSPCSSCSSSNVPQFKYDVFLSFRGDDTRCKFTSDLRKALSNKQIETFIDYKLNRGYEISPSLFKAIEKSQISIIIFSRDYASSKWCLEELVKILECREKNKQVVIPVFYGVDPSDVRHQTGNFAKAFAEHEQRFKESLHKVQRWKDALKETADLSGWHSSNDKPDNVLIKDIVEDILKKLHKMSPSVDSELEKTMTKQFKLISDIFPMTKGWTVKVSVAKKTMPRESQHSSNRYQRLILIDSEGTQVQAVIFGADIKLFEDTLTISKSYYISNAYVNPIKPEHRIVENDFQWTINGKTLVKEVEDDQVVVPAAFSFVSFADLEKYKNCIAEVDIIALAIDIYPVRQLKTRKGSFTIQKVLLVNQELKPMLLTMWDQFVGNEAIQISKLITTKPIVIAERLKVDSYNGISLSTKSSTSFIINPNTCEAMALRSWSVLYESVLKDIVSKKSYLTSAIPSNENVMKIDQIESLLAKETDFWVKASITVTNLKQKFWYMACSHCNKMIGAEYEESFACIHCKRKDVRGTPRCYFDIELKDTSGSIFATIFGQNAETFLSCSAKQLMEQTNEDGVVDIEIAATLPNPHDYLIHVKATTYESRGHTIKKLNIVAIHEIVNEDTIKPGKHNARESRGQQPHKRQPLTHLNSKTTNHTKEKTGDNNPEEPQNKEAKRQQEKRTIQLREHSTDLVAYTMASDPISTARPLPQPTPNLQIHTISSSSSDSTP